MLVSGCAEAVSLFDSLRTSPVESSRRDAISVLFTPSSLKRAMTFACSVSESFST